MSSSKVEDGMNTAYFFQHGTFYKPKYHHFSRLKHNLAQWRQTDKALTPQGKHLFAKNTQYHRAQDMELFTILSDYINLGIKLLIK